MWCGLALWVLGALLRALLSRGVRACAARGAPSPAFALRYRYGLPAELEVRDFSLSPALFEALGLFCSAEEVRVRLLQVALPTLTRLRGGVRVSGVSVAVRQRESPPAAPAAKHELGGVSPTERRALLEKVEAILWDRRRGARSSRVGSDTTAPRANALTTLLSSVLSSLLSRVEVHITEVEVAFAQGFVRSTFTMRQLRYASTGDSGWFDALDGRVSSRSELVLRGLDIYVQRTREGALKSLEPATDASTPQHHLLRQWQMHAQIFLKPAANLSGLRLEVNAASSALAFDLCPASLELALGAVDSLTDYVRFERYRRKRPKLPVKGHAMHWWHFAIAETQAAARDVRGRKSEGLGVGCLQARRLKRLKYVELYRGEHARWWEKKNGLWEKVQLRQLEVGMTLEEIIHFRQHVYASHERDRTRRLEAMGLVDAVFLGAEGVLPRDRNKDKFALQTRVSFHLPRLALSLDGFHTERLVFGLGDFRAVMDHDGVRVSLHECFLRGYGTRTAHLCDVRGQGKGDAVTVHLAESDGLPVAPMRAEASICDVEVTIDPGIFAHVSAVLDGISAAQKLSQECSAPSLHDAVKDAFAAVPVKCVSLAPPMDLMMAIRSVSACIMGDVAEEGFLAFKLEKTSLAVRSVLEKVGVGRSLHHKGPAPVDALPCWKRTLTMASYAFVQVRKRHARQDPETVLENILLPVETRAVLVSEQKFHPAASSDSVSRGLAEVSGVIMKLSPRVLRHAVRIAAPYLRVKPEKSTAGPAPVGDAQVKLVVPSRACFAYAFHCPSVDFILSGEEDSGQDAWEPSTGFRASLLDLNVKFSETCGCHDLEVILGGVFFANLKGGRRVLQPGNPHLKAKVLRHLMDGRRKNPWHAAYRKLWLLRGLDFFKNRSAANHQLGISVVRGGSSPGESSTKAFVTLNDIHVMCDDVWPGDLVDIAKDAQESVAGLTELNPKADCEPETKNEEPASSSFELFLTCQYMNIQLFHKREVASLWAENISVSWPPALQNSDSIYEICSVENVALYDMVNISNYRQALRIQRRACAGAAASTSGCGLHIQKRVSGYDICLEDVTATFLYRFIADVSCAASSIAASIPSSTGPASAQGAETSVSETPGAEIGDAANHSVSVLHLNLDIPITSEKNVCFFRVNCNAVEMGLPRVKRELSFRDVKSLDYSEDTSFEVALEEFGIDLILRVEDAHDGHGSHRSEEGEGKLVGHRLESFRHELSRPSEAPGGVSGTRCVVLAPMDLYCASFSGPTPRILFVGTDGVFHLNQPIYSLIMQLLSGNLQEESVFEPKKDFVKERIASVLRESPSGEEEVYKFKEKVSIPKEKPVRVIELLTPSLRIKMSDTSVAELLSESGRGPESDFLDVCFENFRFGIISATSSMKVEIMSGVLGLIDIHVASSSDGYVPAMLCVGDDSLQGFSFTYASLTDGTAALEVGFGNAKLNWPYFDDTQLFTKIGSIFSKFRPGGFAYVPQPSIVTTTMEQAQHQKWFYMNFVLYNAEVFLPVSGNICKSSNASNSDGLKFRVQQLRVRRAYGGDGEQQMRIDARQLSVSVQQSGGRDVGTFPESVVLEPLNSSVVHNYQSPVVHEARGMLKRVQAALCLQRCIKTYLFRKKVKSMNVRDLFLHVLRRDLKRRRSISAAHAFRISHGFEMDQRSPQTSEYLVELGDVNWRVRFSLIPFIGTMKRMVNSEGGGSEESPSSPPEEIVFRPVFSETNVIVQSMCFNLLDDRGISNDDVLKVFVKEVSVKHSTEKRTEVAGFSQFLSGSLELSVKFLDSSLSRYNVLLEPWPVSLRHSQTTSSKFGAVLGTQQNMVVSSEVKAHFNISPHVLMSVGDALQFVEKLKSGVYDESSQSDGSQSHRRGRTKFGTLSESDFPTSPTLADGSTDVTTQKYLIHNYTGVTLFYWGQNRKARELKNDEREVLKAVPNLVDINLHGSEDEPAWRTTCMQCEAISIQLEGNWPVVENVNVSLVGRFSHRVKSPLQGTSMPIICDIILAGRTKLISFHSGIWVHNKTHKNLTLRLVLETNLFNPPEEEKLREGKIDNTRTLGPLEPNTGMYLPATSTIGEGLLYVQPEGFCEAEKDVIVLSQDIEELQKQEGQITCAVDPLDMDCDQEESDLREPFHCALKVWRVSVGQVGSKSFNFVPETKSIVPSQRPIQCDLSFMAPITVTNATPHPIQMVLLHGGESVKTRPQSQAGPTLSAAQLSFRCFGAASMPASPKLLVIHPGESKEFYRDLSIETRLHISLDEGGTRWVSPSPVTIHDGGDLRFPSTMPSSLPLAAHSPSRKASWQRTRMSLGIHNACTDAVSRAITIYSPYWVWNLTGEPLLFQYSQLSSSNYPKISHIEVPAHAPSEVEAEEVETLLQKSPSTRSPTNFLSCPTIMGCASPEMQLRINGEKPSFWSPMFSTSAVGPCGPPIQLSEDPELCRGEEQPAMYGADICSVEVVAAPPDSIYRHTKVVVVKRSFIMENRTATDIEYRQAVGDSGLATPVRTLTKGNAISLNIDNNQIPMELQIRPIGSEFEWSNAVPLRKYHDRLFGVRLQARSGSQAETLSEEPLTPTGSTSTAGSKMTRRNYSEGGSAQKDFIIPISIASSSSTVLFRLDTQAEAPYRIENFCADFSISVQQWRSKKLQRKLSSSRRAGSDEPEGDMEEEDNEDEDEGSEIVSAPSIVLPPGGSCEYAWDAPALPWKLYVEVGQNGSWFKVKKSIALEQIGDHPHISVPAGMSAQENMRASSRAGGGAVTTQVNRLRRRLQATLDRVTTRSISVHVTADGPTRVLSFHDRVTNATSLQKAGGVARGSEHDQLLEGLEDKLKRVEVALQEVDARFTQLGGMVRPDTTAIDLFGVPLSPTDLFRDDDGHRSHPTEASNRLGTNTPHIRKTASKTGLLRDGGGQAEASFQPGTYALSLGGDLEVTVIGAEGLALPPQMCHAFAVVSTDGRVHTTRVVPQSCNPHWGDVAIFPGSRAVGRVTVDIYSLRVKGPFSRLSGMLRGAATAPERLRCFLGRCTVPLGESFEVSGNTGNPMKVTLPLARRQGRGPSVSGHVTLSIAWRVTNAGISALRLQASAQALAERIECVSAMSPLQAEEWRELAERLTLGHFSPDGTGEMARASGLESGEVYIKVMAARGLQRRSGLRALAATQAVPMASVSAAVIDLDGAPMPGLKGSTPVASPSLRPIWDGPEAAFRFNNVPLSSSVTFSLMDIPMLGPREALGSLVIPCAAMRTRAPTYAWVPMVLPPGKEGASSAGEPLELHLRLHWSPEEATAEGASTAMEARLAGFSVTVLSDGLSGEIINVTVDGMSAQTYSTRREAASTLTVQRVQVDNQLPSAAQPVVLHPQGRQTEGVKTAFLKASFVEVLPPSGKRWTTISSYRDFQVKFGGYKLEIDDLFMDAVLMFSRGLPMDDLWQDSEWENRLGRMLDLSRSFGPPEICALSGLPYPTFTEKAGSPTTWLVQHIQQEIERTNEASSSKSWLFLENAKIGDLSLILTVQISSKLLPGGKEQETSLVPRLLASSGLQLFDVSEAKISIKGLSFKDEIVGTNVLKQKVFHHLKWQMLAEAHKILGGSGPALLGVPLTAVYACSSAFQIGEELSKGKIGVGGAIQQGSFVVFSAGSQLFNSISQTLVVPLALVGTDVCRKELSDAHTLMRYSKNAVNVPTSLYRAGREFTWGIIRGVSGIILDPVWAFESGGWRTLPLGILKGIFGLVLRPWGGVVEGSAKFLEVIALLSLGKAGIEGVKVYRIRAPAVGLQEHSLGIDAEEGRIRELMDWRHTSAQFLQPETAEALIDCITVTGSTNTVQRKTMLLTKDAAFLVKSKKSEKSGQVSHVVMWSLAIDKIEQVITKQEKQKLKIVHTFNIKTRLLGSWSISKTKKIKCSTQDNFQNLMRKLNRYREDLNTAQPASEGHQTSLLQESNLSVLE